MEPVIIWYNYKIYSPGIIHERMRFVEKNMNSLLPLYGKEKDKLYEYSKEHNLPYYEMVSLRNIIRIQKEINSSKIFYLYINRIKNRFINISKEIGNNPNESKLKIKYFLKSTKMPVHFVLKTIDKMPEFKKINTDAINYIYKLQKMIHSMDIEIKKHSEQFEHLLEDYIRKNYKIFFRTEIDIKREKDYTVTPDILFDKPISIELSGKKYSIRWMDAKNYILVNVPFIIKSLNKQAEKYNNIFGMGAFVFHYGFDSSIQIPGTLILDGSFLS